MNVDEITTILAFISTLFALLAFLVSWREIQRNNKAILKLKYFRSHFILDQNGEYYSLEILVTNQGIQLQDISANISFLGLRKSGCLEIPLHLPDKAKKSNTSFLRGSTAEFILTSKDKEALLLTALEDFKDQEPIIKIYSEGFFIKSFPVCGKFDILKKIWNRTTSKLTYQRRVGDGESGKGVYKHYSLLFKLKSQQLKFFIDGVKKTAEK